MPLYSDRRFKTNIAPLGTPLDSILALRGVFYHWGKANFPDRRFGDSRQIGFIAQEVETVFPELVNTDERGYKSVNYVGVIPVAVEAIKAQQREIEALKQENAGKVKLLSALQEKYAQLEVRLLRLEAASRPKPP